MKRVIIFGAGIGGLTVAHELSKFPEYKIDIYEKKNTIGGLARSDRDTNGCPTELCWRVFFGFYANFFKTFSEIPLDNNKTILDNLTTYHHVNITNNPMSLRDKLSAFYNILYGFTSCNERMNELDDLSWWELLKTTDGANVFQDVGPWLGMDRENASYKSVITVGMEDQMVPAYLSNTYKDYVTTSPTSEAVFKPWKKHLENMGVTFHLNNELTSIKINNNKVIQATVYEQTTNIEQNLSPDYCVFGLPVEILDKIIDKTPELNKYDLKNIKQLTNTCLHLQLSFQIYFNQSISLGVDNNNNDNNAFLLVDSPWDLIVLAYDKVYSSPILCINIPNVKGGWSVAACTSYIPGIVYNKPMSECSYDEIIIELWAQMATDKKLQEIVKKNNGFELTKELVVNWSPMWQTFKQNKQGYIETSEPKFTNNAGSYKLRPSFKTHIDNLYISTAYVKETIDIFSMEAANIGGKYVANSINQNSLAPYKKGRPILFAPFRAIDTLMYNTNLPNIGLPLITILAILILFIIIIFIKKLI